ncbi:MAG TPA: amidohydrolase, partial [Peptococcaceae bacterium]|nr:amidohydrolase [Peptococcaceae bacterium]
IGGSISILKTAGPDLDQMVIDSEAGVKAAFGENPKRVYAELKKLPSTRMGIAALLRQALIDAQDYEMKKRKDETDGEILERDLGMELLVRLLNREIPLRAHAHRADDLLTALRIAKEFNLDIVLEHGTEAGKLIPLLIKEKVPVVVGPSFANRAKVEMKEIGWKTAVDLAEAGVMVALITDHSCTPIQYLSLCAAMTVRYGLPWDKALETITINPAKIMKLDRRLGSLEPGKDADFAVFDGDPFHYLTRTRRTYVNGMLAWQG